MILADRVCSRFPEMRPLFAEAARFTLDGDVAAAIDAVKTDGAALHRALHLAKPPHRVVWMEFSGLVPTSGHVAGPGGMLQTGRGESAEGVRSTARDGIRVGYMIEDMGEVALHGGAYYALGCAFSKGDDVRRVPGAIGISPRGVQFDATVRDDFREALAVGAGHALRFFLLLNTRNRVVRIIEGPDLSRLNKQRRRKGKPDLLESRAVKLDLSRPIAQVIRRGGTPDHRTIAAHVVRGHFKLRASGIFWWSPFMRGGRGNAPPPDYDITASKPKAAARTADREAKSS